MKSHPEPEMLSALAEGEPGTPETRDAAAHVSRCAECREQVEAVRATLADLRSLGEPEMDPQASWAIRKAVARERRLAGRGRRLAWAAGSAAAATIAIVAIVASLGGNGARDALSEGSAAGLMPDSTVAQDLDEESANALLQDFARSHGDTVAGLANSSAQRDAATEDQGVPVPAPAPPDQVFQYGAASGEGTDLAECVGTIERESGPIRLARSLLATYKGEPVYALLFEAPAEDPSRVELWILTRADCTVRYFAQADIRR